MSEITDQMNIPQTVLLDRVIQLKGNVKYEYLDEGTASSRSREKLKTVIVTAVIAQKRYREKASDNSYNEAEILAINKMLLRLKSLK